MNQPITLQIAPTYAFAVPRYAPDAPTYAGNRPQFMRIPAPIYAWITVVFHRVYPHLGGCPNICVTPLGPYV